MPLYSACIYTTTCIAASSIIWPNNSDPWSDCFRQVRIQSIVKCPPPPPPPPPPPNPPNIIYIYNYKCHVLLLPSHHVPLTSCSPAPPHIVFPCSPSHHVPLLPSHHVPLLPLTSCSPAPPHIMFPCSLTSCPPAPLTSCSPAPPHIMSPCSPSHHVPLLPLTYIGGTSDDANYPNRSSVDQELTLNGHSDDHINRCMFIET